MLPYAALLVFLGLCAVVGCVLLILSFIRGVQRPDPAKNAPYECGFDLEGSANQPFSVRFYLVAILFIIFDVEVALLMPWAYAFKALGEFGTWVALGFLAILTIGFIYEFLKGALEWE